jgi:hypothetical protein
MVKAIGVISYEISMALVGGKKPNLDKPCVSLFFAHLAHAFCCAHSETHFPSLENSKVRFACGLGAGKINVVPDADSHINHIFVTHVARALEKLAGDLKAKGFGFHLASFHLCNQYNTRNALRKGE